MNKIIGLLVLVFSLGVVSSATADDIEIYFGEGADSEPYVLLMLDLRSSTFSTQVNKFRNVDVYVEGGATGENILTQEAYNKLVTYDNPGPNDKISVFQVFRAVMAGVLEKKADNGVDYAFDGIKMALAVSNWDDGGTILEGYKLLGGTPDGRAAIVASMAAMPGSMSGNETHEFGPKETYWEWYNYLNGSVVEFGKSTIGNFIGTQNPDYDLDIITNSGNGTDYISPFEEDDCPQLFSIIVAMQGPPSGRDTSLDSEIETVFGSGTAFKIETMMEYMHLSTTDLIPDITQVTPLQKSWVISDSGSIGSTRDMAEAGGSGTPLSLSDPVQLEKDLINLFGEVLSVSSTFVAASVPVNVFNQTRSLDNLFVALFEAQDTMAWPGNIKKLKLLDDPNDVDTDFDQIVDVDGNPGFETTGSNKGRIFSTALTFWTDETKLTDNNGNDPNDPEFIPLGADGRVVDRGGAGQKIPGMIQTASAIIGDSNADNSGNARQIFVESATITTPPVGDNLDDFATSLKTDTTIQDLLGAEGGNANAKKTDAQELIRWGRGQDLDDDDDDNSTSDARFWVLADAIHSRPFALNYGDTDGDNTGYDEDNPDIVLLFGTGDGMFHVVENTDSSGNETGREIFGFYPRELLGQIKERRTPVTMSDGRDMRYGVDGEPIVFTVDGDNDGNLKSGGTDEAYVYFGLRRGGYGYYALDIINPDSPKLQWKVAQTRTDPLDSDFDELGLTFSKPVKGKVKFGADAVDVLVFGGGYHGGWDPNDPSATSQFGKDVNEDDDSFGNAIYIVNARDGSLIWKATEGSDSATNANYQHPEMVDSIPSDVRLLETPGGLIHRIYVGDTGGSLWRVDLPAVNESLGVLGNNRASRWFVSRLADLAPDGEDIRFFHAPDIVEAETGDGTPFDGVIIGSGNRADPLDKRFTAADIENYLFYIRDYKTITGAVDTDGVSTVIPDVDDLSTPHYDSGDLADLTDCPDGDDCEALNSVGWKVEFEIEGEKGLSTPLVDAGRVFATTYVPGVEGVCGEAAEGRGRLYLLNLSDASAIGNQRIYDLGPGIPSGAVLIGDVIWLPGGGIEDDLDGDGVIDKILTKSLTERMVPIYWRQPGIDKL